MDEIKIITNYIGIWMWEIISILFLISSMIIFALGDSFKSGVFYVAFFLLFVILQFISFKRRRELLGNE